MSGLHPANSGSESFCTKYLGSLVMVALRSSILSRQRRWASGITLGNSLFLNGWPRSRLKRSPRWKREREEAFSWHWLGTVLLSLVAQIRNWLPKYLQSDLLTLSIYVELDFRWWKILVFRKRFLTTVESRFRKVRKKGRGWSKYEKSRKNSIFFIASLTLLYLGRYKISEAKIAFGRVSCSGLVGLK